MTETGKQKAQGCAIALLKKKVTADKNAVLETLGDLMAKSGGEALDIRERSSREIYYRLLFALLSEDLIDRVEEIHDMPIKDVFDRLIRLTRELREERNVGLGPHNNPLIVIQAGKGAISSIDADYTVPVTGELEVKENKEENNAK